MNYYKILLKFNKLKSKNNRLYNFYNIKLLLLTFKYIFLNLNQMNI